MHQPKRSTSFYLTEEAHDTIEMIARNWGIPKNSVIEIAVRILVAQPDRFAGILADHIEEERRQENSQ